MALLPKAGRTSKSKELMAKDRSTLTYGDRRRLESQLALRETLPGKEYLAAINDDLSREIGNEELPVVRFKTETRLRLLNKVLPDLKAVEHTGADGGAIMLAAMNLRGLSDAELATWKKLTQKVGAAGDDA